MFLEERGYEELAENLRSMRDLRVLADYKLGEFTVEVTDAFDNFGLLIDLLEAVRYS
jgi:hypothetical protein